MPNIQELISINPETLAEQTGFKATRVPDESLFNLLEENIPMDEFLVDFGSISKEQAIKVIEIAGKLISYKEIGKLYTNTIH